LQLTKGVPAEYAFVVGWEIQNAGFSNEFYFKDVLQKSALKLDSEAWSVTTR
jgi:hypothetical protein